MLDCSYDCRFHRTISSYNSILEQTYHFRYLETGPSLCISIFVSSIEMFIHSDRMNRIEVFEYIELIELILAGTA